MKFFFPFKKRVSYRTWWGSEDTKTYTGWGVGYYRGIRKIAECTRVMLSDCEVVRGYYGGEMPRNQMVSVNLLVSDFPINGK